MGLLSIAVQGGNKRPHQYYVHYEDGKEQWLQYPEKNWKRDKCNTLVGIKNRFHPVKIDCKSRKPPVKIDQVNSNGIII